MRERAWRAGAFTLLCLLVQCTPALPPVGDVPATARSTSAPLAVLTPLPPLRHERNLLFATLAGARADLTDKFIADGTMPSLARVSTNGARVLALLPVEPAVAAPAQMSLLTGATPARMGIVADTFHKAGQSLGQSTNGFGAASNVEPFWRSAMRQGRSAAVLGYPAAALNVSTQRADWMVSTGVSLAPAAQHVLKFSEAKGWSNVPPSFSAPQEARSAIVQGGGTSPLDVFVLALDTSDDRQPNYDTWLFSRTRAVDAGTLYLHLNDWGVFVVDPLIQSTVTFKVTDASPAHFAVYQSALMINQVAPPDLARAVAQQYGTIPAPADGDALERNWIDEGTYVQMSERALDWQTAVSLYVYRQFKPDVLVLRLCAIEEAERELLLSDPRQWRYTPERVQTSARALRRAYELVDGALGRLLAELDLDTAALLVASDRGLMSVHTQLNLNRWLNERKWLTYQKDGVDLTKSKALAMASDGVAQLYINLKGREPDGIVEPGEYGRLQSDIVSGLKELTDPLDGQPIFARVLRKQDLDPLKLLGDNSADVFVQARPGYVLSAAPGRSTTLEPSTMHGAGGYDASLPEMQGVWLALGAGIQGGVRLSTAQALDVAPTISVLLRLSAPGLMDGRTLSAILR